MRGARLALAAAVTAASCGSGITAPAPQPKPEDRERAVLAVLGQLDLPAMNWLTIAWPTFETATNQLGRPRLVAQWPGYLTEHGDFSHSFDAERAKHLACELFAAYGLDAQRDYTFSTGSIEVALDGYDEELEVGFKLLGKVAPRSVARAAAEPPATDLTRVELVRLERGGVRLDTADADAYRGSFLDGCTPTLAYLAGTVAFLNEVTSGPDIDLRAVLAEGVQRFPITGLEGAIDWQPAVDDTWQQLFGKRDPPVEDVPRADPRRMCFRVTTSERWEVHFAHDRGELLVRHAERLPEWKPLGKPFATRVPTRLDVVLTPRRASRTIRVTQERADGSQLECTASGASVLLPSSFDAARPFKVGLELERGEFKCEPYVMVGYRQP